ncbi:protein of unknown function [Magnetospirillum sp. XM-1]|nr:protein of unknown function [Magnetospirillum sp. XM-1]
MWPCGHIMKYINAAILAFINYGLIMLSRLTYGGYYVAA